MRHTYSHLARCAALLVLIACGPRSPSDDLIFLDGRGVAASGDSLLVVTRPDSGGVMVIDRRSGAVYRRAVNTVASPQHVETVDGSWYVSDVRDGVAEIAVFSSAWQLERRLPLGDQAGTSHQFAVLPDGRVIIETPDGRLAAIADDGLVTFALVEQSMRTGLLAGARGGVLHAVPDRSITLYNALGKVRWRLDWPWKPSAYAADLAVDPRGRIHVLVGEGEGGGQPRFLTFTLSGITGEVIRWSVPGSMATFSVDRLGTIEVDSPARWLGSP